MKILLALLLTFTICEITFSQSIEKKSIYSSPGSSINLTNGWGMNLMKLSQYDKSHSPIVEFYDLDEKGYLIRQEYKVIIMNNAFEIVKELDLLGTILEKSDDKINIYPSKNGIWITQDPSGKPKNIKVGLLTYEGTLLVESINVPEKYDFIASGFFEGKLFLVNSFERGKTSTTTTYKFENSLKNFSKEEKISSLEEDIKPKREDKPNVKMTQLIQWVSYKDKNYGKNYWATLKTMDLEGNCKISLTYLKNFTDTFYSVKEIEVLIPEYKAGPSAPSIARFIGDLQLHVDAKTNNFFIMHSVIATFNLQAMALISGNLLKEEPVKIKFYREPEFSKYGIDIHDLTKYSLSNTLLCFGNDNAIFDQRDYLLLEFRTRSGTGLIDLLDDNDKPVQRNRELVATTFSLKNMFELSIDKNLEIVKTSFVKNDCPSLKYDNFKLAPSSAKVLYQLPTYKKQESDFIYDEIGKVNAGNNLYQIVHKNNNTYVFNFKNENSEIVLWTIK